MNRFRHHYARRPVDTPDFSLWGVGVHEALPPGSVNRPNGIGCHLLVFFHAAAENRSGGRTTPLPAGTFVLWGPGVAHDFGHRGRRWDHSWMLFGGRFVRDAIRANRIPLDTPARAPLSPFLEKALGAIDREASCSVPPRPEYLRNLAHNLLIDLGRRLGDGGAPPIPRAYLEAKSFLEEHLAERLTLARLASVVHRSVPRFAACFRRYFGVSPIEHLIELRLQRARVLLYDDNLNLAQVGREAGMKNPHYFSRLFRQRFGMSPSEARRNALGDART